MTFWHQLGDHERGFKGSFGTTDYCGNDDDDDDMELFSFL